MKRALLAAALALAASGALAQAATTTTPQAVPSCFAAPYGAGTRATRVERPDGVGFYWWCPNGSTVVIAQASGYRLFVPDLPASAPIGDVLAEAWRLNVKRDCSRMSTDPVVGPLCKATWAAADADPAKPAPIVWRVAPNPSSTTTPPTRPMFSAADPSKQVAERAFVGDLCNCAAPVAKGTQTLCPLRQLGDIVPTTNLTACVKQ